MSATLYLRGLFHAAPAASFIELRYRTPSGMGQSFHSTADASAVAERLEELAPSNDVFVGVLPRQCHRGGRDGLVYDGRALWADCDTPASVAALADFNPAPSLIVRSGSADHRHAYWLLSEPVGIDHIEGANRRLALTLGADPRCADAARILRPPSFNHKHSPPSAVWMEWCDDTRYRLEEVVHHLRPDQSFVHQSAPRPADGSDPLLALPPVLYVEQLSGEKVSRHGKIACPFHAISVGRALSTGISPAGSLADASLRDRRGTSSDPLRSIPAPVYFERLTGLRVGRSGKLRCLFHDDRSPSLHVYREPARGWHCFGCGLGGSIYDLAALLLLTGQSSGSKLRGREFLRVRQRLGEVFLGGEGT